jgi:hypothetical protein
MEELDGSAGSPFRRAIAEVKQRWSVIGWVTKNLFSRTPSCYRKHVKPLAPTAFGPYWARVLGYGQFSLCVSTRKACSPAVGTLHNNNDDGIWRKQSLIRNGRQARLFSVED